MGLTEEERRRLDEIADDLSRDDPRLSRALTAGFSGRIRRRLRAVALLLAVLAVAIAAVGVGLAQPLLVAAGSLLLVIAVWIAATIGYRRYRRRRRDRRA